MKETKQAGIIAWQSPTLIGAGKGSTRVEVLCHAPRLSFIILGLTELELWLLCAFILSSIFCVLVFDISSSSLGLGWFRFGSGLALAKEGGRHVGDRQKLGEIGATIDTQTAPDCFFVKFAKVAETSLGLLGLQLHFALSVDG